MSPNAPDDIAHNRDEHDTSQSSDNTSLLVNNSESAPGRRVGHITLVITIDVPPPDHTSQLINDITHTAKAVEAQSRQPDAIIALVTGEQADSEAFAEILRTTDLDLVVTAEGPAGAPASIEALVSAEDDDVVASIDSPEGWVWLLNPGSEPQPAMLGLLVDAIEGTTTVALAGGKRLDRHNRDELIDVGFTRTRTGRVVTHLEKGDVDQGQLDDRSDQLAVPNDGSIVWGPFWLQTRGTNAHLNGRERDVEFSTRVRRAGHRVVVSPRAIAYTSQPEQARAHDRAFLRLISAPTWSIPFVAVSVFIGSFLRLFGLALLKEPVRGLHDWWGMMSSLIRVDRLRDGRHQLQHTASVPQSVINDFIITRRQEWKLHQDRWMARSVGTTTSETQTAGMPHLTPLRSPRDWASGIVRALWPTTITVGLTALSLLAFRHLLSSPFLSGGASPAVTFPWGDLWLSASSGWRPRGVGAPVPPDPFLSVFAILSAPFAPAPQWFQAATFWLAVPLAGWVAWMTTGYATTSNLIRWWAAGTWALSAPLTTALADGRLSATIAHIALPGVVWALARIRRAPNIRHAWTSSAWGSFAMLVACASAPIVTLPVIIGVVMVALTVRRPDGSPLRALRAAVLWILIPTLAVLLPWMTWLAVEGAWQGVVASPGSPTESSLDSIWAPLFGAMSASNTVVAPWYPRWLSTTALTTVRWLVLVIPALVVVSAVAFDVVGAIRSQSTIRQRAASWVPAAWVVYALAVTGALFAPHIAVGLSARSVVSAYPGPAVSVVLLSTLVVATVLLGRWWRSVHRPDLLRFRRVALGVAVVLATVPLVLGASWLQQTRSPQPWTALRSQPPSLPLVVSDLGMGETQTRSLLLTPHEGSYVAQIVKAPGVTWAAISAAAEAAKLSRTAENIDLADQAIIDVVGALVDGRSDPREGLETLGVGFILLNSDSVGADQSVSGTTLAQTLNRIEGLAAAGTSESGVQAWRVEPRESSDSTITDYGTYRVNGHVVSAHSESLSLLHWLGLTPRADVLDVSELPRGGKLVLAERSSQGWHAVQGDRELTAVSDTSAPWAQAFELPTTDEPVYVWHHHQISSVIRIIQILVVAFMVIMAIPLPRSRSGAVTEDLGPTSATAQTGDDLIGAIAADPQEN